MERRVKQTLVSKSHGGACEGAPEQWSKEPEMGACFITGFPHEPRLRHQTSEVGDREGGPDKEQCKIKGRTQTALGTVRVMCELPQIALINYFPYPTVSLKVYDFLTFYLFTYLLVFMWMGVLLACMYVYIACMPGAWKGQKRALDLLGLELQIDCEPPEKVNPGPFGRTAGAPAELSPAPKVHVLIIHNSIQYHSKSDPFMFCYLQGG